ncbi:hypothetical protein B7P43_G02754 [Cryptotermes secundus]|nr:hypothetical protein B7P43_G02754 [Cryptotermes secundus]
MIVKQCIQFIKKPLTFIFNLSLSSGIFPDQMKIAKVRPIFKKGQKQNITNYRPISILSVFSKILETLMYNRVVNFLNKFKLISNAQNGFRKNKSTFTAIQTFIGQIQKTLDNKQFAFGIFLDLSKAFDVINHNLLLAKLELYGLRGIAHAWMRSYLTDRTQFVEIHHMDQKTFKIKTLTSSLKAIKHGVPQGSVLGPLLFLLFINDLPRIIQNAEVVLFADDTNILITGNDMLSLNEKIQNVKNQLEKWFYENHLIINTEKSKVIFFRGSRSTPIIRSIFSLNNKEVVCSSDVKFLGICITEDLSWATHTQYVCKKLSKTLYLIKSLRDSVSQSVLRNVYLAKFESVLKYGIIFWGGVKKDSETLFKLQKKCLRVVKGVRNRVSCRNLFREFKILTVTSLYIFEILCFIIKNRIYTTQYSDVHGYNTIHKHNLYVQFCNTERCKRGVIGMGTKIFNGLPTELKSVNNFNVFKKKLKNYLLCNVFYSLQEFFNNC